MISLLNDGDDGDDGDHNDDSDHDDHEDHDGLRAVIISVMALPNIKNMLFHVKRP